MKKISIIFVIILVLTVSLFAEDKVAVAIKAKGNTSLKRSNENTFKSGVKLGTSLYNKDIVKTGENGYLALIYLDDKSQIKVKENSELEIGGVREGRAISKQISVQFGKMKADVSKQRKGEFLVATPTSVASVKGTSFWVVSDPVEGDQFYGLSGLIQVQNILSGQVVNVGSNETGTSTPDGGVDVQPTDPNDVPQEPEEMGGEPTGTELRIQFQDSDGNTRYLIIDLQ